MFSGRSSTITVPCASTLILSASEKTQTCNIMLNDHHCLRHALQIRFIKSNCVISISARAISGSLARRAVKQFSDLGSGTSPNSRTTPCPPRDNWPCKHQTLFSAIPRSASISMAFRFPGLFFVTKPNFHALNLKCAITLCEGRNKGHFSRSVRSPKNYLVF